MQTVYLKDGTQANLITKTENGYVVDPLEIYEDYGGDGETYMEPSGNVMLVDKVYDAAPLPVIQEEYKAILSKVEEQEKILEEKRKELRQVEYDINRIKNTKTDISRYIINREELRTAKRLILWVNGHIVPRVLDGQKSHKFNVSYEISQYKGEERCWAYKLWSEDSESRWSNSDYFDEEYGIKVDLTDEEIKAISLDRLTKKKVNYFGESAIMQCPDEWLTPEYIEKKKEFKDRENRNELNRAQEELKKAQEKIARLTQTELAVS